jgi:hypothetical protein
MNLSFRLYVPLKKMFDLSLKSSILKRRFSSISRNEKRNKIASNDGLMQSSSIEIPSLSLNQVHGRMPWTGSCPDPVSSRS